MNRSKVPLILTLTRLLMTFPIIYLLTLQNPFWNWVCVALFYASSLTDYYDGYLARKFNAVTNLGKFLDPVADKVLVTGVLTVFVWLQKVDIWMVVLFVTRDTVIGGIRAAASADGLVIDAQSTGKWKAALQMIAIPLLMMNDLQICPKTSLCGNFPMSLLGYYLLWFSVGLSLLSGWQYIQLYQRAQNRV